MGLHSPVSFWSKKKKIEQLIASLEEFWSMVLIDTVEEWSSELLVVLKSSGSTACTYIMSILCDIATNAVR